jgi:hypothetical protein
MSLDQLKALFTYARIDFSLSVGALDTLKHVLLLRIQSSFDGTIRVDDRVYTKEDLLQIIEASTPKKTFDIESFWKSFPELTVIADKDSVASYFKGNIIAFNEYEHVTEAQEFLTANYSEDFAEEIYARIQLVELFPAAQSITHLFVFNKETQFRISTKIIGELKELFHKQDSFKFMTWEPYYKILQEIANEDQDFLIEQYQIGLKQLHTFSYDQWSTFFKRQSALGFEEEFLSKIERDQKEYFDKNKALVTHRSNKSYSGNFSGSGNQINEISWGPMVGILIAAVNILFAVAKCNSGPDYNSNQNVDPRIREIMENSNDSEGRYYYPQTRTRTYTKEEVDSMRAVYRRVREIGDSSNAN